MNFNKQNHMQKTEVLFFGSFATGFFLLSSDIDIIIRNPSVKQKDLLTTVSHLFERIENCPFKLVSQILNAKVPILKCIHKKTGVKLDIACNEVSGLAQIRHFEKANLIYPHFKYLYLFFKFFLRQRSLNDTFTGGIG